MAGLRSQLAASRKRGRRLRKQATGLAKLRQRAVRGSGGLRIPPRPPRY